MISCLLNCGTERLARASYIEARQLTQLLDAIPARVLR